MNNEATWDKIAPLWGKYRTRISPTVEDFLKDKKGKLLDLGCGSGRNFLNNSAEWYALDISSGMIDLAKKTAEKRGMNVSFKKAESFDLPYEDNFFDSVVCAAVLHCVESEDKRKKTLKEIYRVLKRNGFALISVWGKKSPRLRTKDKECYVPWTTREADKTERYTYVYDLDEIRKQVEDTGFEVEQIWEERNINLVVRKP